MKKALIVVAFAVLLGYLNSFSQSVETTNEVAGMEYKLSIVKNDVELYKLVLNMLPDLSACKEVFVGNYAYEYYDNISQLKESLSKKSIGSEGRFITDYNFVKLVPTQLKDIPKVSAVSYLEKAKQIVKTSMNPNVIYYRGYANKTTHYDSLNDWFFVNIKGKWVTIIEPWKLEKGIEELKKVDNALFKKPSINNIGATLIDSVVKEKSVYGSPTGSGMALNIPNWGLGALPQINEDYKESGRIVFDITVDDTGDVISVRVKEATVSQRVVESYKRAVSRMKLVRKSSNVPSISKGTITFNIKAI